jgi:competence protein ComEA
MKRPRSYVRAAIATLAIAVSIPSLSLAADAITCTTPVNINKADASVLSECVTGLGPKKAEAIVAYRTEHGGKFKSVDEIAFVKGIGSKRAEKFKSQLTVVEGK